MIDRIKDNYFQMIDDYNEKYKSDHWVKMFSKNKFDQFNFENFRKKNFWGINLSHGMEDFLGFYDTAQELFKLLKIVPMEKVKDLVETKVGNADTYTFGDLKINFNEICIINQIYRVKNYLNSDQKIVCEIGGGFGSLASKIKKIYPNKTIILIDLPESLVLQNFYLSRLFPKNKFFLYSDLNNKDSSKIKISEYDFILLPPWSKDKLLKKNSVDIVINSRSFMEMDKKVIKEYFNFIHEIIKIDGIFYCLNKKEKIINNIPIRIAEYPYDENWEIKFCEQNNMHPNMYDIIARRAEIKNYETFNILKNLERKNSHLPKKNFYFFFSVILRKILNLIMFFVPKKLILKIFKIYY